MDFVTPISAGGHFEQAGHQILKAGIGKEGLAFIDIFRDILNENDTEKILQDTRSNTSIKTHPSPQRPTKTVSTGISGGEKKAGKLDEKLLSACRDMEALFTGIMLKSMRETIHENDFFGKSLAKDLFSDMLYDEYAKLMAKTDQIGLARQIYDQLSE